MKKFFVFKKVLCVILVTLLLIPACLTSAVAAHCDVVPYVYVEGQKDIIVKQEDGTITKPLEEAVDFGEMAKQMMPTLLKAFATGDWSEYANELVQNISPIYKDVRVDKNGFPENPNSGIEWSWTPDSVSSNHWMHMGERHVYNYDPRLSPMDVADDLHEFIETVKAKTGHDKINLVTRCLGSAYAFAYIYKYERPENYASINRLFLLSGTHYGTALSTAMLTGTIEFDDKSLMRYLHISDKTEDFSSSDIGSFLVTTLEMLCETHTSEKAFAIFDTMYNKIKDSVLAPVLREYYGSVGMSLSSIMNNRLEEAIEYLYPTAELKEEYSVIIGKARDYNNNVYRNLDKMMLEMDALGIPIFSIAEYGFQQDPYAGEISNLIGDSTVGVHEQSNGATVSTVTGTLSQEYIDERTALGYGDFISVDKQIDASTCLFPERTWFVKNIDHSFPDSLHVFVNYLAFSKEAPTIYSNEAYPQFMNAIPKDPQKNDFTLVPLKEVNDEDIDWEALEDTGGAATLSILEKFLNFILEFISSVFDAIVQIVNYVK